MNIFGLIIMLYGYFCILPPLPNVQVQFLAIVFYILGFNELIKEKVCEDSHKSVDFETMMKQI